MKELTEDKVKNTVINWLSNTGYKNIKTKTGDEHGVDIVAKKDYGRFFYIECKKDYGNNSLNDSAFVHALGQIVTRMSRTELQRYGLALPKSYYAKLKRLPWLFAKRNHVSVLLVNEKEQVEEYTWKELKKIQTSSK